MNNPYILDKCNSIIDRYLNTTSVFRRGDRKSRASELLKLAYEISDKTSEKATDTSEKDTVALEKGTNTSLFGTTSIGASTGAAIGAAFGPLGMLVGSGVGALVGTSIKGVKSLLNFDDVSGNIPDKISKEDLNFLVRNSKLALKSIGDQVISILYPSRLNDLDIRMLMLIADIPFKTNIETINADLGIISEIERYTNQVCVSKETAANHFEDSIRYLSNKARSFSSSGIAKLKVVIAESLSYDNASSNPKAKVIKDMALPNLVRQLHSGEKLIAIVPKAMLYNPGFKHIRKELFTKQRLMAIMDLKQPASPGARHSCALVFSCDISSKILLLPFGWYRSLPNAFGQHISDQQLRAVIKSGLSSSNRSNGAYSISIAILGAPFILTPSYQSKKETDTRFEMLEKVISVVSPSSQSYPSVSGFALSNSDLSKDKPLKPISKGSLEIETFDNPTKWYHIPTDNVVFLHIWNGIVFTGYMEDVKGENFFLRGHLNRIIMLGLNNNSRLRPEYLAQILQSDKYAICQQLLGADYYASSLDALKSAILKIYIPLISEATQYKSIAETTQQQLEQINLEWEQKFKEYKNSVKDRKHALSQLYVSLVTASARLIKYCKNCEGDFDIKENIGGTSTVEDVIRRIENSLPIIGDMIDTIADVEFGFGKAETINVIEVLKKVAKDWKADGIEVEERDFNEFQNSDKVYIDFPIKALQQILYNIFYNALSHGFSQEQPNKKMRIDWNLIGEEIVIRIANNGLPLENSPYGYFTKTRSYRSQNKDGHRSEGIGNLQSKQLMEEYEGSISLDQIDEEDFKVAYTLKFKLKQS